MIEYQGELRWVVSLLLDFRGKYALLTTKHLTESVNDMNN